MENKANINEDINSLMERRIEEIKLLSERGVNVFEYSFDTNSNSQQIKSLYNENDKVDVRIAGRIMAIRRMGKASFAHLQDLHGRIQIYLKKDEIGDTYENFKLMDIGDIVGVEGYIFKTKTGEISVHVTSLTLLAKAVRPIPIPKEVTAEDGTKTIYDQFTDKELRYRQRYVDLIVNNEVKDVFIKRSKIITAMRSFLDEAGLLEVETPVLQPIYGGASARPFITKHNALGIPLYLRIADELYLKRLIVGGFEGVYEISKDFRNEGMDKTHNPEFTMMECYVAYKDYNWMMDFVEKMISKIILSVFKTPAFQVEGNTIDFSQPWKKISMVEAIAEKSGINILSAGIDELVAAVKKAGGEVGATKTKAKLIDELFSVTVQPELIQPSFVIDYPVELSPLAKKHRTKEGLVERFEGYINGKEICNAFSELNDPFDQMDRFKQQLDDRDSGDDEAQVMDDDFIQALQYGMPPTAGLGIGIDRLVMMLTNQSSIRDVILFPTMKPIL